MVLFILKNPESLVITGLTGIDGDKKKTCYFYIIKIRRKPYQKINFQNKCIFGVDTIQSTKAGGNFAPAFFLSQEFLFKKIFSCFYIYKYLFVISDR
jgi:hypothetical protein